MSKLYKTIYTVEVLSDEPLGNLGPGDIEYEITEGHCSGVTSFTQKEITEFQMAKELIRQGSDVDFLLPDWLVCPKCLGRGIQVFLDQRPMAQGGECTESVLPCWRCEGIGMVSPASFRVFNEELPDVVDGIGIVSPASLEV